MVGASIALSLTATQDANALTMSTQGTTTVGAMTISCSGGYCSNYTTNSAVLQLSRFDTNQGVLTSAYLGGTMSPGNLSYSSSRSGSAEFSQALYFDSAYLNARTLTYSSSALNQAFSGYSGISYLAGLVGPGQVAIASQARLDVYKDGGGWGTSTATATATQHTVMATLSYNYLRHANASFASGSDSNVLDLSAGDDFSVFALGSAADTTRLDAGSISCSGDCSAFSLGLASFQDLVAGQGVSGLTSLIGGLAAGQYDATYTLNFADDNALGVGQRANALTLHLSGAVTAVPEPASAALMLGGLGALGLARRRRSPLSD